MFACCALFICSPAPKVRLWVRENQPACHEGRSCRGRAAGRGPCCGKRERLAFRQQCTQPKTSKALLIHGVGDTQSPLAADFLKRAYKSLCCTRPGLKNVAGLIEISTGQVHETGAEVLKFGAGSQSLGQNLAFQPASWVNCPVLGQTLVPTL